MQIQRDRKQKQNHGCSGAGVERMDSDCLTGTGFLLVAIKCFKTDSCTCLCQYQKSLNSTVEMGELHGV